MKIALVTTVYSFTKEYFPPLVDSIKNQTYKNFDTIIYDRDANITSEDFEIRKTEADFSAQREKQLKENKEYDLIIFIDSDDLCQKNRVETILKNIEKGSAFWSDMEVVDDNLKILSPSFLEEIGNPNLNSIKDLINKNFLGFSTLAIKKEAIDYLLPLPPGKVIDWFIASVMEILQKNYLIKESLIKYRQHNLNFIGAANTITPELIKKTLETKEIHYNRMTDWTKTYGFEKEHALYQKELEKLKTKKESLSDPQKIEEYVKKVNDSRKNKRFAWHEFV